MEEATMAKAWEHRRGVAKQRDAERATAKVVPEPAIKVINGWRELKALARELGARPDWHEPDEQGLTVTMVGRAFDNAFVGPGFVCDADGRQVWPDKHVILKKEGKAVAAVNLCDLFAWACRTGR